MIFYNPFKPHIVEFRSGGFAVRRLTLLSGWRFFDSQKPKPDYFWWGPSCSRWYTLDSLDQAKTLLRLAQEPAVKKVHTNES